MLMYQNEIEFFWSLTEQISLDLDYTPCINYQASKIEPFGNVLMTTNSDGWACTTMSNIIPNALTVDIDAYPITVRSEQKPNLFARWVYKAMGVKWERKC